MLQPVFTRGVVQNVFRESRAVPTDGRMGFHMLQMEWSLARKLVRGSRSGVSEWFKKTLRQPKVIGLENLIHLGFEGGY